MLNSALWMLDAAADAGATAAAGADAATAEMATMGFAEMIPSIAMMVAMIAIFWFVLIRPQRKKDKAVKEMLAALKVGDRVCTIGGIYGTVTGLKDDTVNLAVGAAKTPLVMARWAIRSVENVAMENDAEPEV